MLISIQFLELFAAIVSMLRSQIVGGHNMTIGNKVQVTSLAGIEIGVLDSINFNTGKALVFFDYDSCPHFCSFNISQLKAVA